MILHSTLSVNRNGGEYILFQSGMYLSSLLQAPQLHPWSTLNWLQLQFCEEGSLRTALDCQLLVGPESSSGGLTSLEYVMSLAHDVAVAMLHLHRCVCPVVPPACVCFV